MAIFPRILNMVSDSPYHIREGRETRKRGRAEWPYFKTRKNKILQILMRTVRDGSHSIQLVELS